MTTRPIFYIRHTHNWDINGISGSTLQYLYERGAVAIRFDKIDSWKPAEYTGKAGPTAIRYMNESNEALDNRYIFASYKLDSDNKVLLGKPKLGSKCFLSAHLGASQELGYKLLFLEDVREIEVADFPYAYLLAPKQSTFVEWRQCQKIANAFIDGTPFDLFNPDSYLPWALEIACEEYLRSKQCLHFKLLKSGGTLKSFDIIGLDQEGNRVVAQVKHRGRKREYKQFVEDCRSLSGGSFYFFAGNIHELDPHPLVALVSLQDVLQEFDDKYLAQLTRVTL